jgi:hypothetical protein
MADISASSLLLLPVATAAGMRAAGRAGGLLNASDRVLIDADQWLHQDYKFAGNRHCRAAG